MTPKQQRFVEEYLKDLNATQAAIRAGYSPRVANRNGPRLLSNAVIAEAIAKAQAARSKRVQVDADWVLTKLVNIAQASTKSLYTEDDDGNIRMKSILELSDEEAYAISEVSYSKGKMKVKQEPRLAALEALAKHLGLFERRSDEREHAESMLDAVRQLVRDDD